MLYSHGYYQVLQTKKPSDQDRIGEIIRNYNFQTPEGRFTPLSFGGYYNAPAFIKYSCISVSYTHLDVNKRQPLFGDDGLGLDSIDALEIIPVSYTHLIQPDAPLMQTLELDSLDLVDMVVLIDKNFGFTVTAKDFAGT